MTWFAYVALFGWIPCVIAMFATLSRRQAAAVAVIGAWLLLPPYALSIEGLPDYSKTSAASFGLLAGTLIFCPDRLFGFRFKWFDLPMLLWCFSGLFASIANQIGNDGGVYDGLSDSLIQILTWGLPYLFGRIYFGDPEGLLYFATAIIIGGLCYVPPCIYEMRMSPQILGAVYGIGSMPVIRLGGWRPTVFFMTGLELGMWMTVAALMAWWLWRCGTIKKIGQYPFGTVLMPILMFTTIVCRSTGALALLFAGMGVLWASVRFKTRLLLAALVLTGPLYVSVRATNLWSGQQAVDIAESLTETDRAGSLGFRFKCENLLAAKALQRPVFGWGGWGRSKAYFFEGTAWQTPAPTDGLWIIILGTKGFVGLTLFFLAMTLPVLRFGWRFPPGQWGDPRLATSSLVAVLLPLYIFDCLMNAFPNMIYVTLAGGLMGIEPGQFRILARARAGSARQHVANGLAKVAPVAASHASTTVSKSIAERIKLAVSYHNLGRSAKKDGRFEDAESAWRQALELLSEVVENAPNAMEPRRLWCDCLNDLAWLRANHPDPERRDAEAAVALAQRIVEACPDAEAYWNTLGAAYYRAGDNDLSIAALDRAMALGGGTAFDEVFLAMAHARQGNLEQARVEFDRAVANANQDYPGHPELARLCDEAQSILSEANSIA